MKFVHLFETKKKQTRGLTIAYECKRRLGDHDLAFYDVKCGVAYCAPVEQNYSRHMGRTISSNRLTCSKNLKPMFHFEIVVSDMDMEGAGMECLVILALREQIVHRRDWWPLDLIDSNLIQWTEKRQEMLQNLVMQGV